jgi:hypothetical protein
MYFCGERWDFSVLVAIQPYKGYGAIPSLDGPVGQGLQTLFNSLRILLFCLQSEVVMERHPSLSLLSKVCESLDRLYRKPLRQYGRSAGGLGDPQETNGASRSCCRLSRGQTGYRQRWDR